MGDSMRKEEFYFDSRDNVSKIHAVKWIPDQDPICIFQIIHGMAEHVERYEDFATFLVNQGILVVGENHLGHGKTAADGGTKGFICKNDPATVLVRDVHRLKKIVQNEYPGIPYVMLGHSMGSFIFRNYLFRYGTGIDGAIVMGTGTQPGALVKISKGLTSLLAAFQGWKHPSNFINIMAFGSYNKKVANPETPFDWLSADKGNVARYIEDPECGFTFTLNGFHTIFELVDRLNQATNYNKMPKNLPLLLVSGAEDPVGNYGLGVEKAYELYKEAGMKQVTKKLYEGNRHEILNEANKQTIYEDILNWLKGVL